MHIIDKKTTLLKTKLIHLSLNHNFKLCRAFIEYERYKIDSVILNENKMNKKILASKVPNIGAYIL